ncbi:MAG: signal peptidase I [Roseiflexaceae bacterium]|nr:signal peptidase I [Roseiflexaceae bacterium]
MDETPLRRRIGLDAERAADHPPAWEQDDAPPQVAARQPRVRSIVRELFETAIFVLLVFLIVRGVVQNFKIEGQSMEPTLQTGQYILVNKIGYFHFDLNAPMRLFTGNSDLPPKIVYPFQTPQRGDIVVFEYPLDYNKDYIKRVIGLPGDRIQVKDGSVYVNENRMYEPYLVDPTDCRPSDPCANGAVVTVPPGSIYVMGDNRLNSSDSREWSELPLDRVIGKAWVSYWPIEDWSVITHATYPELEQP